MRIFKITDRIEIVCEWKKTRTAFKHEATFFLDGREQFKTKICYLNRTWERFEYQSVLIKAINQAEKDKIISREDREICMKFAEEDRTDWSGFQAIKQVCAVGEIICNTQKEKNDWKKRMIKAGLGDNIQIPEDWETLSEDEKEKRLNLVIEELGVKKNE